MDSKNRLAAGFLQAKDGWNNLELNWTVTQRANTINMGTTETRTLNVTGCFIVRLFGSVAEIGKADTKQLITDYAAIVSRLSLLEGNNNTKRFTIIYPNGGSKVSPANITLNSRYIVENPNLYFAS